MHSVHSTSWCSLCELHRNELILEPIRAKVDLVEYIYVIRYCLGITPN